ncbi:hypothetical protein [Cryobacterium sp. MDB2-A-2]|uniref:hypothetical protein n=2 Tax=unclassified Cryobacterium TaxID=2649013 RepID=UPI0010691778|nr:hypothetical protein [Cryobacterium sp. MDB2-A-2]
MYLGDRALFGNWVKVTAEGSSFLVTIRANGLSEKNMFGADDRPSWTGTYVVDATSGTNHAVIQIGDYRSALTLVGDELRGWETRLGHEDHKVEIRLFKLLA